MKLKPSKSSNWHENLFIVRFLSSQHQRVIHDQQKIIQTLQQEATRLQKRLVKLETEGVVEPSIMFTRLDAERNERALQQAVDRGKLSEGTYNVSFESMNSSLSRDCNLGIEWSNDALCRITFSTITQSRQTIYSISTSNAIRRWLIECRDEYSPTHWNSF